MGEITPEIEKMQEAARPHEFLRFKVAEQSFALPLDSIERVVRADARDTHQALVDAIHALPDDPGSESWSVWLNQEPPWKLIAANTYEHYAHHLKACCKIGRYPGEW